MPAFKDDQIMIIAPGSQTTLAQLGLPESLTPAKLRVRSCMFPGEKEGEWEPTKLHPIVKNGNADENGAAIRSAEEGEELTYEEDFLSDEGATWPIVQGRVANWPAFYALLTYIYNTLNPPFHTAILLVAEPAWTLKEHEKITQFFFEKFKPPAFSIIDSAVASTYAYGLHSATVVDVGFEKADITAINEFLIHDAGRVVALANSGGQALTKRLRQLLEAKGFDIDMCEQLKRSPICEILPTGTPLPGTADATEAEVITNPAAAASTGATGSGPGPAAAVGTMPRGPGPDTEVGDEQAVDDENEGVLDVASIVTGGKMSEFLARKEKEKVEKSVAKKKGMETIAMASKLSRLPNTKRERNTFYYEDHKLLSTLKAVNIDDDVALEGGTAFNDNNAKEGERNNNTVATGIEVSEQETTASARGAVRREIEVGVERFQAASDGFVERIADAIHRVVSSVEEVNKRSELWDSLVVVGNGTKIRGFKEALLATIQAKYIISPSSATIFTSELPSNISTPAGTGANTPQPQFGIHPGGSQVNPLLLAATTAQNPHLHPASSVPSLHMPNLHSSHGQTPTSAKFAKIPEYFPEWKEVGFDEATFLGAQISAKVLFVVDQGPNKGYMTRTDYNDQGPTAIHDFSM